MTSCIEIQVWRWYTEVEKMDCVVAKETKKRIEDEKGFFRVKTEMSAAEHMREIERERPYNADLSLVQRRAHKLKAQLSDKAKCFNLSEERVAMLEEENRWVSDYQIQLENLDIHLIEATLK